MFLEGWESDCWRYRINWRTPSAIRRRKMVNPAQSTRIVVERFDISLINWELKGFFSLTGVKAW